MSLLSVIPASISFTFHLECFSNHKIMVLSCLTPSNYSLYIQDKAWQLSCNIKSSTDFSISQRPSLNTSHAEPVTDSENKEKFCPNFTFCTYSSFYWNDLLNPSNPYSTFRSQPAQMSFPPEATSDFQNKFWVSFLCSHNILCLTHITPMESASLSLCLSRESLRSGIVSSTLTHP